MTTPDDLASTRTHTHRVTEASFIVGNEAAILGVLEGRDREIEALRARVGWEVADKNEYTDRLRDLAADLSPFGCRPTMDAVKVLDYARVAIFDLIRERDQLREELTIAENARDRLAADRTAALATARLDGARVMRDDIADRLADSDIAPFALVAEIRAIDPAAVVGSGS